MSAITKAVDRFLAGLAKAVEAPKEWTVSGDWPVTEEEEAEILERVLYGREQEGRLALLGATTPVRCTGCKDRAVFVCKLCRQAICAGECVCNCEDLGVEL